MDAGFWGVCHARWFSGKPHGSLPPVCSPALRIGGAIDRPAVGASVLGRGCRSFRFGFVLSGNSGRAFPERTVRQSLESVGDDLVSQSPEARQTDARRIAGGRTARSESVARGRCRVGGRHRDGFGPVQTAPRGNLPPVLPRGNGSRRDGRIGRLFPLDRSPRVGTLFPTTGNSPGTLRRERGGAEADRRPVFAYSPNPGVFHGRI
jgi:hypothetical protein